MYLTNCYSEKERKLGELDLELLSSKELIELSRKIKAAWNQCIMQDENIVINALTQITEELGRRMGI